MYTSDDVNKINDGTAQTNSSTSLKITCHHIGILELRGVDGDEVGEVTTEKVHNIKHGSHITLNLTKSCDVTLLMKV